MKKSIFALLFSTLLTCFGLCFVVDDVKADTDVQRIEVCDFTSVDLEAPAISTVDPVPLVDASHDDAKEINSAGILEETLLMASAVEHRQRYWRNRSWGKPIKAFNRLDNYPKILASYRYLRLQPQPVMLC